MQWYLASFFLFGTIFIVIKNIMEKIQHPNYISKGKLERVEYLQLWTGNCHHFIICFVAYYFLTHSECDGAYDYIFLKEKKCFYTVDSGCIKANFVTIGYLSYDFILYRFFMPTDSALNQQSMWHHVVGILGLGCGMLTGFGVPSAANVALTCELSTFFLNYRTMYSKEELNKPIPLVNQIVFFITFTLIRVMIFPILAYMLVITIGTTWHVLPTWRKGTAVILLMQFVLMFSLNMYWYSLVLKGLKKLLEANGILKASPKKAKVEANKTE